MLKEVIMPIGLPAIGKSTFLKDYLNNQPHQFISPDNIRKELTGDTSHLSRDKEVWPLARKRFEDALKSAESINNKIILDATFMHQKARKPFLDIMAQFKESLKLTVFTFPVDVNLALERQKNRERKVPEVIIRNMAKNFEAFSAKDEAPNLNTESFTIDKNGNLSPALDQIA